RRSLVATTLLSASVLRDNTLNRGDIQAEVGLAGKLDQEITLAKFKGTPFYCNHQNSTRIGEVYLDTAKIIDGCGFSDVFFVPFLSKGGAEKFAIPVIKAIV